MQSYAERSSHGPSHTSSNLEQAPTSRPEDNFNGTSHADFDTKSSPPFTSTQNNLGRSKRKQVKNACVNCQKACKKCDEARPCQRCVKFGLTETCIDSPRKERRKGVKRGPYKKRTKLAEESGTHHEHQTQPYPPNSQAQMNNPLFNGMSIGGFSHWAPPQMPAYPLDSSNWKSLPFSTSGPSSRCLSHESDVPINMSATSVSGPQTGIESPPLSLTGGHSPESHVASAANSLTSSPHLFLNPGANNGGFDKRMVTSSMPSSVYSVSIARSQPMPIAMSSYSGVAVSVPAYHGFAPSITHAASPSSPAFEPKLTQPIFQFDYHSSTVVEPTRNTWVNTHQRPLPAASQPLVQQGQMQTAAAFGFPQSQMYPYQ